MARFYDQSGTNENTSYDHASGMVPSGSDATIIIVAKLDWSAMTVFQQEAARKAITTGDDTAWEFRYTNRFTGAVRFLLEVGGTDETVTLTVGTTEQWLAYVCRWTEDSTLDFEAFQLDGTSVASGSSGTTSGTLNTGSGKLFLGNRDDFGSDTAAEIHIADVAVFSSNLSDAAVLDFINHKVGGPGWAVQMGWAEQDYVSWGARPTHTGSAIVEQPGTILLPSYMRESGIHVFTPSGGVTGTATPSLPMLTATSAGTVKHVGTAAPNLPGMTASASGTAQSFITGSAAPSLPTMTGAAAGTSKHQGTAAPSLPAMTASAAGQVSSDIIGTAAPSLPTMQASAAATAKHQGTATPALPVMQASGSGTVSTGVTGTAAPSLPGMTCAGSGTAKHVGTAAPNLPGMQASAAGMAQSFVTGTGAPSLPGMAASASATAQHHGTAAANLPVMQASGVGVAATSITGTAAPNLPTMQATGNGTVQIADAYGPGAMDLPGLTMQSWAGVWQGILATTTPGVIRADFTARIKEMTPSYQPGSESHGWVEVQKPGDTKTPSIRRFHIENEQAVLRDGGFVGDGAQRMYTMLVWTSYGSIHELDDDSIISEDAGDLEELFWSRQEPTLPGFESIAYNGWVPGPDSEDGKRYGYHEFDVFYYAPR